MPLVAVNREAALQAKRKGNFRGIHKDDSQDIAGGIYLTGGGGVL